MTGGDTGPHLCLSQEDSLQHIKTWVDRNVLSGSHMMTAPDLDSLAAIVPGHRRIIEVGCYCGALTRLFALFGERVWSVDWLIGDEAAGHEYPDVHADITNYLPLLAPGGVMCGHDAGPFEGVTQAVDELLPGALLYETNYWAWREGLPDLEVQA